jgi:hypothetical protein
LEFEMSNYAGSYRWCDWSGTWHDGYPTNWDDCQSFQKCDDQGNWQECDKPDGLVEGSSGGEVIDAGYVGDPEGDRIDNNDAVLPGEAPNDDIVLAGAGDDTVVSGDGDDEIYGGSGDDSIDAGVGDDFVEGNAGKDTIYGGLGNDTLYGDEPSEATDHFPTWKQDISNVVFYFDCDGDGEIDYSVKIDGFPDGGDKTFVSNDLDVYYEQLRDYIIATDPKLGDGATVVGVSIKGGIQPTQYFAVSDDTNGSDQDAGPTMNTGPGNDATYQYGDFHCVYDPHSNPGAGYDDKIYGGDGLDVIYGGGGDDLAEGGTGNDTVYGGTGNDTIVGDTGDDSLYGGDDRDVFYGGNPGDFVDGNEGGDDYDILDLSGSGPLKIDYDPTNIENGTVSFLDEEGNVTGTMEFRNIEKVIPCFTPGTMIATPRGERPVEELKVGDRVITRDNGIQEIRWIGQKALNWRTLGAQPHLRPVLVRKGSLGHGLPERDMMVSPNHRVLVANDQTQLYFEEREVLVAAKHLVNNAGITSAESLGVTYVHFMFDHHEVVLSDGCWTESFQPGDFTLKGIGNAQRAEILELFPELKDRAGLDSYGAARRTLKKHEAQMLLK